MATNATPAVPISTDAPASSTPTQAAPAPAKESLGTKIKLFFEHLGDFFGKTSNFEKKAALTISVITPLLQSLIGFAAGTPAAAKVSGVVTQVTNDLNDTAAILNGAQTTGGVTLQSLLSSVQTNLATLLTDADVKNSTNAEKITAGVNTVLGEVSAIVAAIPADFTHTPVSA